MTLMQFDEPSTRLPTIAVIGVGGGGGNAVRNMVEGGVDGVEYVVVNTDRQVLETSPVSARIQIGSQLTKGMGAGADPNVGLRAAMDDQARIADALQACDMCVITAGMGGGTGTGAAPVVAKMARELGALTVAVVTMPFGFEGRRRQKVAEWGLVLLRSVVDTRLVIPNDRVLALAERGTRFRDAFKLIDNVVLNAVASISEIITTPGYVNVDFNDVRTVMLGAGRALMGTGRSAGADRAREAAELAIASPLLDGANIDGATGILICVTGGDDLEIHEVEEAAQIVQSAAHADANIIWGTAFDPSMEGELKVTVIATGFDRDPVPVALHTGAQQALSVDDRDWGAPRTESRAQPEARTDRFHAVTAPARPAAAPAPVVATAGVAQVLPGLSVGTGAPSELHGMREARVSAAPPAVGGWNDPGANAYSAAGDSWGAESTQPPFIRRRLDDYRR